MNTQKRADVFESDRIGSAVLRLALPTVVSQLITTVYNLADTFFVGQTGDKNQVAAVSVAMPVFLFFLAIGNLFGVGGCAYISRSLGKSKDGTIKYTYINKQGEEINENNEIKVSTKKLQTKINNRKYETITIILNRLKYQKKI